MADDEIEELLQAAQDEMILKLSVNSHTSRSHPSNLDPDLHSRFLALKSLNNNKDPKKNSKVDEDDLMLRFAALKKTTVPSPSSSSSFVHLPDQIGEEDGEDAQVEKLIQWAIDAARLDPSPPSDDDDDDDHSQSSDSDDSTNDVKP